MSSELICVGAIAGSFGVRGEIRLKSFTAEPRDIGRYAPLSSKDGATLFDITVTRQINNGFAARIAGVTTKEEADQLKGTRLYAPRERLPNLPDDEFYHADLMGMWVFDTGGTELGRVKAVHNHGAGDMLEIQTPAQKSPALLPFTKEAVPTVDLRQNRIIIDPPDGVFDQE